MCDLWKLARIAIATAFVAVAFAAAPASAQQASGTAVTDKSPTGELSFWNKIKDAPDVSGFKIYLETFPNGMFYEVALAKFKSLGGNVADLKAVAQINSGATNPKVKSLGAQKTQASIAHGHVVFHKKARRPLFHKAPHRHVKVHHKRIKWKKLLTASPDPFAGGGGGGGGSGGGGGWHH